MLELKLGLQLLGIQRLELRETWGRVTRGERKRERTRQGTVIANYGIEMVFFILKVEGTLVNIFNRE